MGRGRLRIPMIAVVRRVLLASGTSRRSGAPNQKGGKKVEAWQRVTVVGVEEHAC